MCGRYTLTSAGDVVGEELGLEEAPELEARYNISPGRQAPVVQVSGSTRRLIQAHWGFSPAKRGGRFLINARSETVDELPSFARAFESRRCLVPASGFFEWKKQGVSRAPYYLRLVSQEIFAMAGLWRSDAGTDGGSYVILTTTANELVGEIHDRMPVILGRAHFDAWLDPSNHEVESLLRLLQPISADLMVTHPVSSYVNSALNEGARCVVEVEPEPQQQSLF